MALPIEYKPNISRELIRLGRDNDGGYLVDKKSIDDADLLISFGLNTDCSFEYDFWNIENNKIISFDHTISKTLFKKKIKKKLIPLAPLLLIPLLLKRSRLVAFKRLINEYKMFKYLFSQEGVEHIQKEIGYHSNGCIDVDTIVMNFSSKNIFFKIDIEGSEYRILNQLIKLQHRICGLVIEFHDCDLHQDKIVNFIQDFALPLVHTHANNFGSLDPNNNPVTLELSFGAHPSPHDQDKTLQDWQSSPLDQPNHPARNDYVLEFNKI